MAKYGLLRQEGYWYIQNALLYDLFGYYCSAEKALVVYPYYLCHPYSHCVQTVAAGPDKCYSLLTDVSPNNSMYFI